jgi:hypothetical protein
MANCHKHFDTYNGEIRLTDARRKSLNSSRKEIRNRIRNWFKENKPKEIQPKFGSQGSMSMDTIINPIPRKIIEGDVEKTKLYYDVDDGVYFIGNASIKDRNTPATYHSWVYQAVDGHTDSDPVDKNTCVRTIFADGHHIDNPIYYKQGDSPELAHKRDGYISSDPQEFTRWFNDQADTNPQLRRLVRYIKGWRDNMEFLHSGKKMPSGLILTILVAENIIYRENRDDISLKETLISIQSTLQQKFVCYRPTTPKGEDLLDGYTQKDYFMKCLSDFILDAKKALPEKNYRKATELWRIHLSTRFPLGDDAEDESSSSIGLSSIIPSTTRPYAE